MLPVTFTTLGESALLFGGFVAALFLGSLLVPGPVREGVLLPDGSRQRYKLNGFRLMVLLAACVAGGSWLRLFSLATVYTHFWSLLIVANGFAVTLTAVLYLVGPPALTHSGRVLHDLYYGVEINPTWLGVDLKMFSYRPSLLGLGLVNVSFAVVQYDRHGELSARMALYQLCYLAYLVNYFQFEHGMLYTWDIIAERFGGMLIWGDYVLVPFFYSLPGWFLVDQMEPLSPIVALGLIALYLVGFCLFRGANEQKHRFRTDPHGRIWGRPAEALGGKLLVSGFWGVGRKLNYTGELCMYYAWTLTCGLVSPIPYLLPAWLTVLLSHRAWRDEQRCRAKYGELWEAYCRRARFRMVPFVY
jgi:delta14-sterol reductase